RPLPRHGRHGRPGDARAEARRRAGSRARLARAPERWAPRRADPSDPGAEAPPFSRPRAPRGAPDRARGLRAKLEGDRLEGPPAGGGRARRPLLAALVERGPAGL